MKFTTVATALGLLFAGVSALEKPLDIDITEAKTCGEDEKTKKGMLRFFHCLTMSEAHLTLLQVTKSRCTTAGH